MDALIHKQPQELGFGPRESSRGSNYHKRVNIKPIWTRL